ncbi:MAG: hypothetical protein Q7S51_00075 [Gallionellaceae bacterium]|nr:hypothetical protein [Gallionellaceae bacterium]
MKLLTNLRKISPHYNQISTFSLLISTLSSVAGLSCALHGTQGRGMMNMHQMMEERMDMMQMMMEQLIERQGQ